MNKKLRELLENLIDEVLESRKYSDGTLCKRKEILKKYEEELNDILGQSFNKNNYCNQKIIADGNKGMERG